MKAQKSRQQLQKFSIIFMQLGLVFALFMSYVVLEHKSIRKYSDIIKERVDDVDDFIIDPPVIFIYEPIKTIPKQQTVSVQLPPVINQPIPVLKVAQPIIPVIPKKQPAGLSSKTPVVPVAPKNVPVKKKDVTLRTVGEVPVYPGCKGTNAQKRACFEKKLRKFVGRKYNGDVGDGIVSKSKKQRVRVIFKINKYGEIEILKTSAKYKQLEKEAIRVIKKLPKMMPGKNDGKPVDVIYTLPITVNTN